MGDPPTDVTVSVVRTVFLANVAITTVVLLLASVPYYFYPGEVVAHEGFAVAAALCLLLYAALCWTTWRKRLWAALALLAFDSAAMAGVVGFGSALLYNSAPIQFMLLSWAQSMAIVLYTYLSPRRLHWFWIGASAALGALAAWLASLFAFVVEHDWNFAIAILLMSLGLVLYNVMHAERAADDYSLTDADGMLSICHYYCQDVLRALGWCASSKSVPPPGAL